MKNPFWSRYPVIAAAFILNASVLSFDSHAAAGEVDLSFDPGSSVNGAVNVIVVQPDGKVLIGGRFTTVQGLQRFHVARLNADGSCDATFNPNGPLPYSTVSSLALQPDGKVLIAGQVFHSTLCDENGCYDNYLSVVLRLNSDGSLDVSFNPGVGGAGDDLGASSSLALQPDGMVLVGGYFRDFNGTNRRGLVRLGTNGVLDASFDPGLGFGGLVGGVNSVTAQPDGKILICGSFTYYFGVTNRIGLARLNANGSLDSGFQANFGARHYRSCGGDVCYNVAFPSTATVQPDGKVLVGFRSEHWQCDAFEGGCSLSLTYGVTRLNEDGSSDPSFVFTNVVNNTALLGSVSSIAMQADGRIMVGSSAFNTVRLGRLNTNGSWDNSFHAGTGPDGAVLCVGLQPNGHVLIGGDFLLINGVGRPHVARLLGDTPSPMPSLRIGRSSSFVTISWPLVGGFVLDQSLTLPGNWSQVLPPYTTNGNSITVSVSTPVGNKFYRLRRP